MRSLFCLIIHVEMPYRKYLRLLTPIDIITLGYIIVSGIYILLASTSLHKFYGNLTYRVLFITIILMLIYINGVSGTRVVRFFRYFYPLGLLMYFYPETASINNFIFKDLDPFFANIEVGLFGGYPSVWFSQYMPWKWFNELMSFGYFSYFPLIFLFCYIIYRWNYKNFSFSIFVICMSFYMYYILFILFPVAGPQFYLTPPNNQLPDGYLFRNIMKVIEHYGEGPTAAFPSSHVGIISILLYLVYRFRPSLFKWYLPVSILLCLSTVYTKAHYVVDVIGGLLTAPVMYWISSYTYYLIFTNLKQINKIQYIFDNIKLFFRTLIHQPTVLDKHKHHIKLP